MKLPPGQEIEYLKIMIEENRTWGYHKIADLLDDKLQTLVATYCLELRDGKPERKRE
ncbi:MAG TPA: hypothetical protein VH500_21080 [Nitrososphaeraceae archaeon]|jgi:hypothetical protein